MRRGPAALALVAVASFAVPALASADESPVPAEIRSGEVPVGGPWVRVGVACLMPEGRVCTGRIWISGVWGAVAAGRVQEARVSFAPGAGPAAIGFVQLVPAV
jgi:hypothetical protein